jgi:hypothetical protein
MLHYNRLYQSLKKVSAEWHAGHVEYYFYWDYLRFYSNGTVISCNNNSDNINDLNWFQLENTHSNFNKGTFSINNNKLEIQIPVDLGLIKSIGEINKNSLILLSKNEAVNFECWNFYNVIL